MMEVIDTIGRLAAVVGNVFRKAFHETFTPQQAAIVRERDGLPRRRGSRRRRTGRRYASARGLAHARENARRVRQFRTDDMGFTVHSGQIVWGTPANANARAAA